MKTFENFAKSFTLCFLIIFIYDKNFAQDVGLTTQAQVNAFSATVINGSFVISGADITDLTPLSTLTLVTGDFYIYNNQVLTNLDGLNNITSIGNDLIIDSNPALISIDGLNGITSVGRDVVIINNDVLIEFNGLYKLVSIGRYLHIPFNLSLENIDGLRNLSIIGSDISIAFNNSLKNIDGLQNVSSPIRNLEVYENPSLDNLCGLYTLLSSNTVSGGYLVYGNISNPTQTDILNNCGSFSVDSKIFLEGPYNTSNSNMNTTLSSVPLNSPFSEDPKSVGSIPTGVVDWVLLQLRDKLNPSTVIGNRSAFILNNGDIVDLDGSSPVLFPEIAIEYFLSVKHRNHLSAMSAETIK